jgi:hypothetical protein
MHALRLVTPPAAAAVLAARLRAQTHLQRHPAAAEEATTRSTVRGKRQLEHSSSIHAGSAGWRELPSCAQAAKACGTAGPSARGRTGGRTAGTAGSSRGCGQLVALLQRRPMWLALHSVGRFASGSQPLSGAAVTRVAWKRVAGQSHLCASVTVQNCYTCLGDLAAAAFQYLLVTWPGPFGPERARGSIQRGTEEG